MKQFLLNSLAVIAVALLLSFMPSVLFAQTITWNGSAGDNDWNNAANWNGGAVPAAGEIARFGFGTPTIDVGPTVAPAQILLAGGASLTLNADVTVGDGVTDQHGLQFSNGSLTVSDGVTLTVNAPDSKNGFNSFGGAPAYTVTNAGTISFVGGNNALSIQNDNNLASITNTGVITSDGIKGMFLGDAVVINNSGHMEFLNLPGPLTIGTGPTPGAVFNNLQGGVLTAFGDKMNVNGTFFNEGLFRTDFDGVIFASSTSTVTNNAFYDNTVGVRAFASGPGNPVDNGIQVNRNFAVIDMGGTCFADIGEVSYNYYQFSNQNGTDYGTSDGSGVLDLTANINDVPVDFPKVWTEELGDGNTYFVALDNYCGQLPIQLLSFSGNAEKDYITLEWSTASEENNVFVAAEKLLTTGEFVEIGRVRGNGDTRETRFYVLRDDEPRAGTNTYRLRQVDFDGTESLSEFITVYFTAAPAQDSWIYPTLLRPGTPLNINLTGKIDHVVSVDVISASGRLVQSFNGAQASVNLPVDLPAGTYIVRARDADIAPVRIQVR